MKVICRAVGIACLLFFLQALPVWGAEYDGDQVVLSWSSDNAHSQTITWHSREGGQGYVQYDREGKELSQQHQVRATVKEVGDTGYFRYEAEITGLRQETMYEYRIGDGMRWSRNRTFMTAPESQKKRIGSQSSFQFLYLGDVQYQKRERDYPLWGKMIENARQRNPGIAFGILGGDMVNSSRSMKDWQLFLAHASPVFSFIPMMTAIGNHETSVKAESYLQILALPENGPEGLEEEFYSFDYQNCHIAVLNTSFFLDKRKVDMGETWATQLQEINRWIREDLTGSEAAWKIIVMHHPAYGISDGDPIYREIRENWGSAFQQGQVDLILCGHQHVYMRTREIGGATHIMGNSGKRRSTYFDGANVPEYSCALDAANSNYQILNVSEKNLSVLSYDEKGQIIDKWEKRKEGFPVLKAAAAGLIVMQAAIAGTLLALPGHGRRKNMKKRLLRKKRSP